MYSKQSISKQTKSVVPIKKYSVFCKICFDAGKTEKEFSNHCVKDKQGSVVCPTLLSLNCRYCKQNGHTVSYCSLLKTNQILKEKTIQETTEIKTQSIGFKRKNIDPVVSNLFNTKNCDLFPPLSSKSLDLHNKSRDNNISSYAEKVKIEITQPPHKNKSTSFNKQDVVVSSYVKQVNSKIKMAKNKNICWADEESSDEESSYEEDEHEDEHEYEEDEYEEDEEDLKMLYECCMCYTCVCVY